MLRKLTIASLTLGMVLLPASAFAAKKVCLNGEGDLVVKKNCNPALGLSDYSPGAAPAAVPGPQGPAGPQGIQGEKGDSVVLCYANIKSDGSLLSYGGNGTTGINVSRLSAGKYQVKCTGSFPGITSAYDTVKLATVQSNSNLKRNIHTTNSVNSETELSTTVKTFDSVDSPSDQFFSLVVMGETS